jgi:hypothetical protein
MVVDDEASRIADRLDYFGPRIWREFSEFLFYQFTECLLKERIIRVLSANAK